MQVNFTQENGQDKGLDISQISISQLNLSKSIEVQKQEKTYSQQISKGWNQKQLEILFNQYKQHGSLWQHISTKVTNKSPNNIKNKFNNSVRSIAKILASFQRNQLRKLKENMKKELLLSLLQIANQTQKIIIDMGLTINWQSKLYSFKLELLNLCLRPQKITSERLHNLLKIITNITLKMRCFSIFKAKSIKNWKINDKVLNFILTFDKITQEQIDKFCYDSVNKSFPISQQKLFVLKTERAQSLTPLIEISEIQITQNQPILKLIMQEIVQQKQSNLYKQLDHCFYP